MEAIEWLFILTSENIEVQALYINRVRHNRLFQFHNSLCIYIEGLIDGLESILKIVEEVEFTLVLW